MTLTNYWLLLLWLAAAGAVCRIYFQKKPVTVLGKTEYRWGWVPVIILMIPYVIWAASRKWIGDTETYRSIFLNLPTNIAQFPAYIATIQKDVGFTVISLAIKLVIGNRDVVFFFLIATFQMLCVAYFFRKYSKSFLLCVFMFIASTDYISWVFNGMRQFIAVCITLLCFDHIIKKQYFISILLIFLAATIHGSAILMIPIIFVVQGKAFNKRTILAMTAIALAVVFIGRFSALLESFLAETQYGDIMASDIWKNDDGTNIFRVAFYSIPAILALVGKKEIQRENDPVVNLCVNYSIMTVLLYILSAVTSGIYIGRIPIYTTLPGYAVCPEIIEKIFTKRSVPIVIWGLIVIYLLFFFYQMHFTWGLI